MQTLEFEKKILLIGDGSVGKTSLVRRFVIDKFDDKYIMTIGTKTSRKPMTFTFEPEQLRFDITVNIWDILGQSGMERAHKVYFKEAEAFILVFDGTRRPTFDGLVQWASQVVELCGSIPGVLACNKVDLKDQYQVTDEEVASLAKQLNLNLLYTSAKTGENVEAAFQKVGTDLCYPLLQKYAGGGAGAAKDAGSEPAKKKGLFKK
jgi:small GTP-binding protein